MTTKINFGPAIESSSLSP